MNRNRERGEKIFLKENNLKGRLAGMLLSWLLQESVFQNNRKEGTKVHCCAALLILLKKKEWRTEALKAINCIDSKTFFYAIHSCIS